MNKEYGPCSICKHQGQNPYDGDLICTKGVITDPEGYPNAHIKCKYDPNLMPLFESKGIGDNSILTDKIKELEAKNTELQEDLCNTKSWLRSEMRGTI